MTEEWKLFSGNMAETVNVSIEGDRMYVDHINPEMPEAVAMGVIEGDKVRFATDQYLGQNGAYYSFSRARRGARFMTTDMIRIMRTTRPRTR